MQTEFEVKLDQIDPTSVEIKELIQTLVNNQIKLEKFEYDYGKKILPLAPDASNYGKIGIIISGMIEVLRKEPRIDHDSKFVWSSVAVHKAGSVIGEMEHLFIRHIGRANHEHWVALSGIQSFYFTKIENNRENSLQVVREQLRGNSDNYKVEVLWFDPSDSALKKDVREQIQHIINRIYIKRTIGSLAAWNPPASIRTDQRGSKKSDISRQGRAGWFLFLECIKAIQNERMVFTPASKDTLIKSGPWDNVRLIGDIEKADDSYLVMVPSLLEQVDQVGVLITQYMLNDLCNPAYPHLPSIKSGTTIYKVMEVVSNHFSYLASVAPTWRKHLSKQADVKMGFSSSKGAQWLELPESSVSSIVMNEIDNQFPVSIVGEKLGIDIENWSNLGLLETGGIFYINE